MPGIFEESKNLVSILPPVRVLAVDNKADELDSIQDGLMAAGVPCIPLMYDLMGGIEINEIMDTSHVRFLFMDLNLNEIENPVPTSVVGPLIDALMQLNIPGPYALIFWTKHSELVDEVMNLLKERISEKMRLPFFFTTMHKDLLSLPGKGDATYKEKLTSLTLEINKVFHRKVIFSSILTWENKVLEAASNTLKTLHDTVRAPQISGVAQKETEFSNLLKNLATSAWGGKAAVNNWGSSVASGLSPFLADNLDYGISCDSVYGKIWGAALGEEEAQKLPAGVPHILNTSCAIDSMCKVKDAHGVWLEFKLTISPEFINAFGDSGRSLLDDFVDVEKILNAGANPESKIKLGMLDITRTCDYANRKHGLRRFVLGAIVSAELYKKPKKKHEAIHQLPEVSLDDGAGKKQQSIVQVNLRYVLSLPDNSPLLANSIVFPRFRIRKQILMDVIAKFGAHSISPGILSFY
jgi:hypothetical protein